MLILKGLISFDSFVGLESFPKYVLEKTFSKFKIFAKFCGGEVLGCWLILSKLLQPQNDHRTTSVILIGGSTSPTT